MIAVISAIAFERAGNRATSASFPLLTPLLIPFPWSMLEALQLAAKRGETRLFADLSFQVERSAVLTVTGRNGSGKTTLLRILAGLSTPFAGTVKLDGETVAPYASSLRRSVAFAGHAVALKDELSATENLAWAAALAGMQAPAARIDTAIERVGLARQRALPARVLSQGQRRRVALARLLLAAKPLWLLDEPTTALDAAGMNLLQDLLEEHLAHGGAVIAATHQPLPLSGAAQATLALE
jgi:heme exporter protein A